MPLYRDAAATEPNLHPGLTDTWRERLGRAPTPDEVASYLYAVMAHDGYTRRFRDELETCEVRVPLTADAARFNEAAGIGRRLLWLHTYGERFVPKGKPRGTNGLPKGTAKCVRGVSSEPRNYPESFRYDPDTDEGTLYIGEGPTGGVFRPVEPEVWAFEVSGLRVLESWLGYRMPPHSPQHKGKKTSPLDEIGPERWSADFTSELLALLSILEHTLVTLGPQAELLERIVAGPLIPAESLPPVPAHLRKPPTDDPELFAIADAAGDE